MGRNETEASENMEGDMTGTPMAICPTYYAVADARTGAILNVTRRLAYAAKRLQPGTVWGSGATAETAKAAAKKTLPPYPDPNAWPPDGGADVPMPVEPERGAAEEVPDPPVEEDIPF